MDPAATTTDSPHDDRVWWKRTWTLGWDDARSFGTAFVAVVAVFSAVGWLLYRIGGDNSLIDADERVTNWFVDRRTDARTDVATWGAHLADTIVKVALTAIVAALMLRAWRRWREALLVIVTLTFEASAFIATSYIVSRPRPDDQLVSSPVDNSFPSGHVAAATVYAAFAVIVFWHTRAVWARALAVVLSALVPLIVAVARVYQGMHYLSDVVAGVVLGIVSLVICTRLIGAPPDALSTPLGERRARANDTPD